MIFLWITRQLFPIILVQGPHSDPLWKKHCMSNKKIISCFQYPVKTTVFTVYRKSFHTGYSNLTSIFFFICSYISTNDVFFAVKTSPNMIGLTVKHTIIKKQLKTNLKVPGVLFSTIFEDCLNADWLVYWNAPLNCLHFSSFLKPLYFLCFDLRWYVHFFSCSVNRETKQSVPTLRFSFEISSNLRGKNLVFQF